MSDTDMCEEIKSHEESKLDVHEETNSKMGIVTKQPNDILSNDKVGVDIVPKVNGNTVTVNLCSCAITFGFSK